MKMPGRAVFDCREAHLQLDGLSVLSGVDFSLSTGEFVVLLGDNGAGKTTLVKALLGLLTLKSGSIKVFGEELPRFRDWNRIGYVPQRVGASAPVPATVGEVVLSGRASFSRLSPGYTRRDRELARQALEAVQLTDHFDRPVGSLSGGQSRGCLLQGHCRGNLTSLCWTSRQRLSTRTVMRLWRIHWAP